MKEKPNTSGTPEGLPLVGIERSNDHRKEHRRTSPVPSNFMIIFRLENARAVRSENSAETARDLQVPWI